MLVVIAIVGVLLLLLFPVVQFSREAARKAQCQNNQRQIGTAILNYATTKDKFPPGFTTQPALSPPRSVGWVPSVLPYLERSDLYEVFLTNRWSTLRDASLAVLVCPSRSPTGSPAPLSYAVNCGMTDNYAPASRTPMDWKQNGVFFNQFSKIGTPQGTALTTDWDYIARRDGTSQTLMLAENVDALDWIVVSTSNPQTSPIQLPRTSPPNQNHCWWQGIVWTVAQPSPQLNRGMGTVKINAARDYDYARPSSSHPGGFNVTMCDGHVEFVSDDMAYSLYARQLTPHDADVRLPGSTAMVAYPIGW